MEVETGTEDEEVVYDVRAKLFIFGETMLDAGTGKMSWRERGVGQARILRHKEHQRLRILMRQEKTMKVICNHALDRERREGEQGAHQDPALSSDAAGWKAPGVV